MHETYTDRKERPVNIPIKTLGGYAAVAAGVTLLVANYMDRHREPGPAVLNGPHMEYSAKPGDTEEGIGSRAYPHLRLDQAAELVDRQNPNPDHLVEPGQVFVFNEDAKIGDLVDPSAKQG